MKFEYPKNFKHYYLDQCLAGSVHMFVPNPTLISAVDADEDWVTKFDRDAVARMRAIDDQLQMETRDSTTFSFDAIKQACEKHDMEGE